MDDGDSFTSDGAAGARVFTGDTRLNTSFRYEKELVSPCSDGTGSLSISIDILHDDHTVLESIFNLLNLNSSLSTSSSIYNDLRTYMELMNAVRISNDNIKISVSKY
jgi:hypothetical protein